MKEYIRSLGDERIRYEADFREGITLGERRNRPLDLSTGEFIAIWDDDDWSHPARLAIQLDCLLRTDTDMCFLPRLTLAWPKRQIYTYSGKRLWEVSTLTRRSVFARYPPVGITHGEDTAQVNATLQQGAKVGTLDAPDLYVYHIHGENTMSTEHFEWHIQYSTGKPDERTRILVEERLT